MARNNSRVWQRSLVNPYYARMRRKSITGRNRADLAVAMGTDSQARHLHDGTKHCDRT
ncbi:MULTISPECIES: hypothetical protein [Mycobacteriaceae]|jgi:hypothetical protein|uniref:hypothetical protein n=1 Tax=Mycobacteriaceae TaxID=1762 RepID=UPI0003A407DF|nr:MULTISPECIES: hypothetical protein [Mycobacteriaceae]CDO24998.1 hypothetical protein BN978_05498 [Mycolicibacterium mageritense DSM 44476 = CIP 104973]